MKKVTLLGFALSAMACMNVSAEVTLSPMAPISKTRPATSMVQKLDNSSLRVAASRADENITAEDVAGVYDMTASSYLSSSSGFQSKVATITAVGEGQVYIEGLAYIFTIEATVASDGTLTIPSNQYLGYNEYNKADVYFCHYLWNEGYDGVSPTNDPIIGQYNSEFGTITFDDDDLFAVDSRTESGILGYLQLWDTVALTKQVDDSADWESCGTATLVDGWIYNGYGLDQLLYPVANIPVEKNKVEEGVYRLVDPYHNPNNLVVSEKVNESSTVGYIKFNIANPAFPFVYPGVRAGFADLNGEYYCYDLNGYYHVILGYSASKILSDITEGLSTYDEESQTLNIPKARFGITSNPNGCYSWKDSSGNAVDMTSMIIFDPIDTGIESVSTSNNAATEVYYNLQGVRVDQPTSGLYIVRKGDKTSKVLVK